MKADIEYLVKELDYKDNAMVHNEKVREIAKRYNIEV